MGGGEYTAHTRNYGHLRGVPPGYKLNIIESGDSIISGASFVLKSNRYHHSQRPIRWLDSTTVVVTYGSRSTLHYRKFSFLKLCAKSPTK